MIIRVSLIFYRSMEQAKSTMEKNQEDFFIFFYSKLKKFWRLFSSHSKSRTNAEAKNITRRCSSKHRIRWRIELAWSKVEIVRHFRRRFRPSCRRAFRRRGWRRGLRKRRRGKRPKSSLAAKTTEKRGSWRGERNPRSERQTCIW